MDVPTVFDPARTLAENFRTLCRLREPWPVVTDRWGYAAFVAYVFKIDRGPDVPSGWYVFEMDRDSRPVAFKTICTY